MILESKKIKSVTVSIVSPSIWMMWWDQMPWSLYFECWVLSQLFYSPVSPVWWAPIKILGTGSPTSFLINSISPVSSQLIAGELSASCVAPLQMLGSLCLVSFELHTMRLFSLQYCFVSFVVIRLSSDYDPLLSPVSPPRKSRNWRVVLGTANSPLPHWGSLKIED